MAGSKLMYASGYIVIAGSQGVYLNSGKGGFHLNLPDKQAFFMVDTKNLASIQTEKGFINIVDDGKQGMVDIQADDLVNLAVLDSTNTQFTGVNIVDGKTHIGVFGTASFDRLHVESKKIKLESSAGIPTAATPLGLVEVTPSKVTIKCMESIMEVDVNGFSWQNAAKSFKMVLETNKFFVEDISKQNRFEIDLNSQTVSMTGVKLATESLIQTEIQTLENKITLTVADLRLKALAALQTKVEGMIKDEATLLSNRITAIENTQASLNSSNGCWIARAVFGEEDIRWRLFRHWLFGHAFHPDNPTWLQGAYLRHGPWVADMVRRHPWLRRLLLPVMERCIRRLRGVPHPAFGRAALSLPVNLNIQPFTR
jgi:hypothetical protein